MSKKRQISWLLIIAMLLDLIVATGMTFAEETGIDIGGHAIINAEETSVIKSGTSEKLRIFDDSGIQVQEINVGDSLFLRYTFKIDDSYAPKVKEGDYFKIKAPENAYFTTTHFDGALEEAGVVIATYELDKFDNTIKFIFSKDAEGKTTIDSGFFGFKASVDFIGSDLIIGENAEGDVLVNVTVDPNEPGVDPGEPEVDPENPSLGGIDEKPIIDKTGSQHGNANEIAWGLKINYDQIYNLVTYNPQMAIEQRKNMLLIDELPENVLVDRNRKLEDQIDIKIPVYAPNPTGVMSGYSLVSLKVIPTLKMPEEGQSYEDYKKTMRSSTEPTVGWYFNEKTKRETIILAFGDLYGNGQTYYNFAGDKTAFEALVDDDKNLNDEQKAKTKIIYGETGPTQGQVIGYDLSIVTMVVGPNGKYKNKARLEWSEGSEEGESGEVEFTGIDGGINTSNKVLIRAEKLWEDEDNAGNTRPNSIQVQLKADGENIKDTEELKGLVTLDKENNWKTSWEELPKYKITKEGASAIDYTLEEVSNPEGYTSEINKVERKEEDKFTVNFTVTNTYTPGEQPAPETTKVEGEKIWNHGNNPEENRPKEIVVELWKTVGGEFTQVTDKTITVTPDENGDWKYSFENLPKYENGEEVVYSVKEQSVPDYTNEMNGYNIKNTYNPLKTTVHVTKSWDDKNNQDGIRPKSIKVQLYAGTDKYGDEVELNESNNWSHSWTNLDKKAKGIDIKYTVKEVSVPDGYEVTINDSNLGVIVIVNKHTPTTPPTIPPTNPTPEIDIEGEKTWEDYNNEGKRPSSIVVNLLADNVVVRTKTVTPDSNGNWKYSFTNLPKYKNDKLIKYTVEEVVPENYEASYSGYNIKNRYTEEETNITVKKVWDDENNKDNLRTDSIKVQLYGNGEKRGEVIELNEDNNWNYNWTGLKKIVEGREVTYTVREVEVPSGYEVNYDESVRGSVTITNTYKPITTTEQSNEEPTEEPKEESKPEEPVKALKLSNILPKTGVGAMTSLATSGISLLAVGMYLLKKKK